MKSLSIENSYVWAQRFVAREWRLLLPVAFAFMALPLVAVDLLVPSSVWTGLQAAMQAQRPDLAATTMRWLLPVMLVILAINLAGGLAITAMALLPGISVREALALAFRRIGILIAALLLVAVVEMAVVLGCLIVGMSFTKAMVPQSLLFGVLLGLGIFAGIRLIPLRPMVVSRHVGPIAALRESWIMTRGAFWRILGALIVYLVGGLVVVLASSSVLGALFVLLGKASGAPELGAALDAIVQRGIGAVFGVGFQLLAASIFRQIDGASRGI